MNKKSLMKICKSI